MERKKRALITGISGMDGTELSLLLLDKGYEVHGIVRRHSVPETQDARHVELGIEKKVKTYYGDLTDAYSIARIIRDVHPDEIYHLGAQSHVRVSFDVSHYTIQSTAVGTLNVLEAMKEEAPAAKTYIACSSEMFGNNVNAEGFQDEQTPMSPVSPYGCAKVLSYNLGKHYRRAYNLFIANGILFNHTGIFRSSNFITAKIAKIVAQIHLGIESKLEIGNLKASRDFGASRDYVKAMWMMLQHDKPDDFVIASGKTYSVEDICKFMFSVLGMNYLDYIKINPRYYRSEELHFLRGDASKAKKELGWKPETDFENLMEEMLNYYLIKCHNE